MDEDLERLRESGEHCEGSAGYLLFTTESGIFPFVKFEEQLAQINDYCVFLLACLREKVREFEPFDIEPEDYWSTPDTWQYHALLSWEFLYRDINQCTLLLLLLAFLESTLNEIAGWFSDMTGRASQWKKVRDPKVSDCLRQIGACCGRDVLGLLSGELAYYDTVRKVRNQFVHNEWEQITDRYEKFTLADVIDMISHVIAAVERSALDAGLIG